MFHNRQIHSIKVGSMSRRLAQQLRAEAEPEVREILDPDVCEAAGLAHDLGHPPFGHQAERVLKRMSDQHGVQGAFEGNAQSFRIVTAQAQHAAAYDGLNLTRATLRAMLKYPWAHDPADAMASRKWGFYRPVDTEAFAFAMGSISEAEALTLGPMTSKPSLEAQVMDWADDIAYAVHDVEDFYRAGLVPLDRLKISAGERARVGQWIAARFRFPRVTSDEVAEAFERMLRGLFAPETPYRPTKTAREGLRAFSSALIRSFVSKTHIRGLDLDIAPEAHLWVDVLKEAVHFYVLEGHAAAAQQHGQERIIERLFEMLMSAADPEDARVPDSLLPLGAREALQGLASARAATGEARVRMVCDAICGLSEIDVIALDSRTTGSNLGSLTDRPL